MSYLNRLANNQSSELMYNPFAYTPLRGNKSADVGQILRVRASIQSADEIIHNASNLQGQLLIIVVF